MDTSPRSDADAASGESKVFQTGFSHLRKENLDHPVVLVRQSPKHVVHFFQRDLRTNLGGSSWLFNNSAQKIFKGDLLDMP